MESETTRYAVPFTPLADRIAEEAPELSAPLAELRTAIGADNFEKYINSLTALRRVDNQLLLITKREMYRTIINSQFLPALKHCFSVQFIRIVNQ